jgi:hypothetical protein
MRTCWFPCKQYAHASRWAGKRDGSLTPTGNIYKKRYSFHLFKPRDHDNGHGACLTLSHQNPMDINPFLKGCSLSSCFWQVFQSVCQARARREPAAKSANTSPLLVGGCCLLFRLIVQKPASGGQTCTQTFNHHADTLTQHAHHEYYLQTHAQHMDIAFHFT